MIKTRNILITVVTVILLCLAVFNFTNITAARSSEPQVVSATQDLVPIMAGGGGGGGGNIYDGNNNKLMYNRVTGMVFSDKGVVYTKDSKPVTFNDKTETFEDSLQERLELVERSTGGLQNYYLMFGEYHVNSINIEDELYIAGIKANTTFNRGKAYDMLIKREKITLSWWDAMLQGVPSIRYNYYDLRGWKIDEKYLETPWSSTRWLTVGGGFAVVSNDSLIKFDKWGTVRDLLDEINVLMEQVPPTGSPLGEFALNIDTGAFLRDDMGQKIRINEYGQLIDPLSFPLIGADARPLWWRENIRAYVDFNGEFLQYGENDTLKDKNGFIVRSVMGDLMAGTDITAVLLADGITLLPVTMKLVSLKDELVAFYDFNGNLIDPSEIIPPTFNEDDFRVNWPEEFSKPEWLRDFKDWFNGIWKGVSDFFNSVWDFLQKWGLIILGVIAVIIIAIILIFVRGAIKIAWSVIKFIAIILWWVLKIIFCIVFSPILLPIWIIKKRKGG